MTQHPPKKPVFDFSKPIDQQPDFPVDPNRRPWKFRFNPIIREGTTISDEEWEEKTRLIQELNKDR